MRMCALSLLTDVIELLAQANFPAAQVCRFCNIVRYIDFLQHTLSTTSFFEPVKVKKPHLKVPNPPGLLPKVKT